MQRSITKKIFLNTFWLSVLLHLLLLLSFSLVIIFQPEEKKKLPNLYVPSYVYTGAVKPSVQQRSTSNTQQTQSEQKKFPEEKNGIKHQSILAATYAMLQQDQMNAINSVRNTEPIYLVGDENEVADPLVKLVGKSLSAHFAYPKMAGEFGIKGKVLIGLTLHPEGYFTDVEMLRSSDSHDLDAAALYAVNEAPTVRGADRYISEPKHFVIGFIFK